MHLGAAFTVAGSADLSARGEKTICDAFIEISARAQSMLSLLIRPQRGRPVTSGADFSDAVRWAAVLDLQG